MGMSVASSRSRKRRFKKKRNMDFFLSRSFFFFKLKWKETKRVAEEKREDNVCTCVRIYGCMYICRYGIANVTNSD